jgi:dethiobiotin synthetase
VVLVVGTGTEVGKTWVSARVLEALRESGVTVAARKPAQSFEPEDDPTGLDAAILGQATGEPPETVCPLERWYEVAMAPPMAAEVLGRAPFTTADLVEELRWPHGAAVAVAEAVAGAVAVAVGLVESAGGVRSPQAADGDAVDLCHLLAPDLVLLVADAGLGTINSVRLSVGVLRAADVVVVLNRFDPGDPLHVRNRRWLAERDGLRVVVMPGGAAELAALAQGISS